MTALLTAVESAAAWLVQPCTQCTCTKAMVRDLDPDPDCPGAHPVADGCRSHSHVAARIVLADNGIHVPPGKRAWLRRMVLTMLLDLQAQAELYTPVTAPTPPEGGHRPHLALVPTSAAGERQAA